MTKKPKILFVLHLPPPVHGSSMVGSYIYESSKINGNFKTRYINLGTSATIDDIGKGGIKKIFTYLKILINVLKQALFFRPQLAYVAITAKGGAFYKDVIVVVLLKLFRIPIIYHLHNKGVSLNQNKKLDNILYKFAFKNTKVILLSKHLYPDIQKYVPKNNVFYCPNGIPDIQLATDKNYKRTPVRLLFLSNLIESKGVFILLHACKILKEKGFDFACNYVGGTGDISEADINNKIQEFTLENHVCYLGKKYGSDKHYEFLNADVFIFPTFYHYECLPLVILEAMQYSLPVISTFEGGIPDVIIDNKTGFLVEQKNILLLAEKIEQLILNPKLRKEMGLAGRKRYEEHFTLQHFEQNITNILTNCIHGTNKTF